MAGGKLIRRHLAQLRRDGLALFNGVRTAGLETAPGLGVHDLRRFAGIDRGEFVKGRAGIRNRGQQELGVGMSRVGQKLLGRADLDDVAGVHDDDSVSDVSGRSEVVGDVEDGDAFASAKIGHEVEDADANGDVEHRDRLVGENEFGTEHQCLSETNPLALAAAQFVGVLLEHVLGGLETNGFHHAHRLGTPSRRVEVRPVQLDRAHDAVRDPIGRVDGAVGVLKDHRNLTAVRQLRLAPLDVVDRLAVEANNPRARPVHRRQQLRDRALAAPTLAHQRNDLAPADRKAHVVDGVQELLGPEASHPKGSRQA